MPNPILSSLRTYPFRLRQNKVVHRAREKFVELNIYKCFVFKLQQSAKFIVRPHSPHLIELTTWHQEGAEETVSNNSFPSTPGAWSLFLLLLYLLSSRLDPIASEPPHPQAMLEDLNYHFCIYNLQIKDDCTNT